MLSLMMLIGLIPLTSFAQQTSDDYFRSWENDYDYRTSVATWTLTNQTFGEAPLGSGLLILTAVGAGYAISRRKRSRKGTMMILVLAMILSFTQCKKNTETITPVSGEKVHITLKVGGGSRHDVNTATGEVTYAAGDKIYVGNDGKYIGTLTCSKDGEDFVFGGDITDPKTTDYLHFYFVGGLAAENIYPAGSLTAGTTTSFTVDISDQSSKLPVLSYVRTAEYYYGGTSYTCMLLNKCALVKFTLANPAGLTQVGDMHTEATINFGTPGITPTGTTGSVKLYSKTNTEKWAILLPQTAVNNAAVTIGSQNLTVNVPEITANAYITDIPAITNTSAVLNLGTVSSNQTVPDGWTVIGTLGSAHQISIADGATVTLRDAAITCLSWGNDYAGITCSGNATIVLEGTNTVKSGASGSDGCNYYPGIYVSSGNTLTIQGSGTLNASCFSTDGAPSYYGAGIGGGKDHACGNIVIYGGTITATGGIDGAAGIGGGDGSACGNITINGGTITATGGNGAAGIGAARNSTSGSISITNGTVEAHAGNFAAGIGAALASGNHSTCSGVSINGGSVTASGGLCAAGIGSGLSYTGGNAVPDKYSQCGNISITGGTVDATGGNGLTIDDPYSGELHAYGGAGIGTGGTAGARGYQSNCGNITIGKDVYSVTATKGDDAQNSIGKNHSSTSGTCGTVSIEDGANVMQN